MTQRKRSFYPSRRHLVWFALTALAVYVLLPQIGDFRSSWQLLQHPQASWTAIAVLLTFATFVAGTGTYCFLAFRRLLFGRTLLVQLAAMFINRLLPAGIGALGANYLYLRRERHTASQAVSVVAVNNLLGFVGHGLLVLVVLLVFPGSSLTSPTRYSANQTLILAVAALVAIVLVITGFLFGRNKVAQTVQDIKKQLFSYRHRPWVLLGALATSMTLTLCNVLCLFYCLHALGLELSFAAVLLVFTFGVGTGAAVPTPGGLGGFEAGLAAGFVAYGLDPAVALAAALLFRLISYWLPLITGLAAFIICHRQRLFGTATA
jgi:glycosyltransferase 2 family protein